LQVQANFAVGGQIGTSSPPGDGCEGFTWGIPYRISWTATDPSDIWDYNLWTFDSQGEPPDFLGWWGDSAEWPDTYFSDTASDYDGECGGGSLEKWGWGVTAYDHAGNAKYAEVFRHGFVVQENGDSASFGSMPAMFSYTGQWQPSTCTCASGGRQVRTTQRGATASFSVGPGEVGVVMAKGRVAAKPTSWLTA
jgi:hypothetical protein